VVRVVTSACAQRTLRLLDQAASGWEVIIVGWQPPQAMEMVGQDHDSFDIKGMIEPCSPQGFAQVVDALHQKVIAPSRGEIDRKEVGAARDASTRVSSHG